MTRIALLLERAKECPSCWERTQFFSEPTMCRVHKEAEFDPAWTPVDRQVIVPSFAADDARLAAMHGYAAALARIEGKLDQAITALKAGAVGAWGNPPA